MAQRLLLQDAKVEGLLAEVVGDLVVIGLGVILVARSASRVRPTSLADDSGPDVAVGLAERWCDELLGRVGAIPTHGERGVPDGLPDHRSIHSMDSRWRRGSD